jgi:hypothetical protein
VSRLAERNREERGIFFQKLPCHGARLLCCGFLGFSGNLLLKFKTFPFRGRSDNKE